MNGMNCLNAFHFNNHQSFNQQIDSVSKIEFHFVIHNRQANLCVDPKSPLPEFVRQAGIVSTLQKSGAEQGNGLSSRS